MKKFHQRDEQETDNSKSVETKRRKNMKRLGGGGLSLHTFANMKSDNNRYNHALMSKIFLLFYNFIFFLHSKSGLATFED